MDSPEALGRRWRWMFKTLSAAPRRQIIGSLLETAPDRSLSLPEAANMPEYRLSPEELRADLIHNHLPVMAEEGFIEWELEPLQVRRGPNFDDVASVLLAIDEYDELPAHLTEGCHFHGEPKQVEL